MNADTIRAIADLAWPVLVTVVVLALLPTIVRIVRSRDFTLSVGDFKVEVGDAAEKLRKDIEDLQNKVLELEGVRSAPAAESPPRPVPRRPAAPSASTGYGGADDEGDEAEPAPPPEPQPQPSRVLTKTILWVDDNPENNAYEMAKLQGEGHEIAMAKSTGDALRMIERGEIRPSIVISDMGRREGIAFRRTAGLSLIRALREKGINAPAFVYASSDAARQYAEEVVEAGGQGITASPMQLYKFIAEARA